MADKGGPFPESPQAHRHAPVQIGTTAQFNHTADLLTFRTCFTGMRGDELSLSTDNWSIYQYFSSLERLRLAQDGPFSPRLPRRKQLPRHHSTRPKSNLRNAPSYADHRPHHLGRPPPRHLRKTQPTVASYLALQADAEWFRSLPSKIQQTHFSREEQVLFASTRNNIILDAADESLLRRRQHVHTCPDDELSPHTPGSSENLDMPAAGTADTPPIDSAVDMDDGLFSSFRWMEDEEELDLSLDEYHAAIVDTVDSRPAPGKCKPSFRRHLSVGSIQFPRKSSSSTKPSNLSQTEIAPPLPSPSHSRRGSTFLGPRHRPHASVSSIDPRAKHYRDPEARLKLRVYLASPQKFDEALEFGFPSIPKDDKPSHARACTSPRLTEDSERTFFQDDSGSLFENKAGTKDDASVTDCDSPRTPQDVGFEPFRLSGGSSLDHSGSKRPVVYRKISEPYTHACGAKREMTLHMTLTRPDLRTTEGTAVAPTDASLHVTALPSVAEQQSIWDTLPVENSKVKRLWRRIKRT